MMFLGYYLRDQENNTWKYKQKCISQDNNIIGDLAIKGIDSNDIQVNQNISKAINWNKNCGYNLKIRTHEKLPIPLEAYSNFSIGMGWDTQPGQSLDIDSSIIAFDAEGNVYDSVSFEK